MSDQQNMGSSTDVTSYNKGETSYSHTSGHTLGRSLKTGGLLPRVQVLLHIKPCKQMFMLAKCVAPAYEKKIW